MSRFLCLDGSLNGRYATLAEADAAGYKFDIWPNGESVWVQASTSVKEEPEGFDNE